MTTNQNSVAALLDEAERSGFYGSLEIQYIAGNPALIRRTQTFKPQRATEDSRTPHECRRYSKRGPEHVHP